MLCAHRARWEDWDAIASVPFCAKTDLSRWADQTLDNDWLASNQHQCDERLSVKLVFGTAAGRGPTQSVCLLLSRPNTTVGQRFALELHKSLCATWVATTKNIADPFTRGVSLPLFPSPLGAWVEYDAKGEETGANSSKTNGKGIVDWDRVKPFGKDSPFLLFM